MIRPVFASRLNHVLPRLNSLRAFTAPTRRPRPVFLAIDAFLSRLAFSRPQYVVETGRKMFSRTSAKRLFLAFLTDIVHEKLCGPAHITAVADLVSLDFTIAFASTAFGAVRIFAGVTWVTLAIEIHSATITV